MVLSFATASAQQEGEEWKKGEYEEMLATYPKLYVYPDGRYLITNTFQKKSEEVAFTMLFWQKDLGKVKTEGKLSEKFIRQYLKEVEPFNPGKVMMNVPCCHVYDKNGRIVGSFYPPNSCPSGCKKPFLRRGRIFQMDCCPPREMTLDLMDNLQLRAVRPR